MNKQRLSKLLQNFILLIHVKVDDAFHIDRAATTEQKQQLIEGFESSLADVSNDV